MRTIAADILIPICTAFVAAATAAELTKKTAPVPIPGRFAKLCGGKLTGNKLAFTEIGVIAALQMIVFLVIDGILSAFTIGGLEQLPGSSGMDIFPMLLVSWLGFTAILFSLYGSKTRLHRFFSRTAIAAAVLLLAECFFFGAKSLTTAPRISMVSQITALENAEFSLADSMIQLNGDNAVIECMPGQDTRAIVIRLKKEDKNRMLQVTSAMKDDNFSRSFQQTDQRFIAGNGEVFTLNLDPYGRLHAVRLTFGNVGDPVTVYDIAEASAQPFVFMTARYLLLLLFAAAVTAVCVFGLHRVTYDRTNKKHRFVLAVITAACTVAPVLLFTHQDLIEYNLDRDVSNEDIFVKAFDAMQHGQSYLRMDVSPELAALSESEVYDNSVRNEAGIYYAWDHAFKDGKYYSYFGITPLITLYYPVYWLTHKLPTISWAINFFALFAAAFTCFAVIAGTNLLVKKPNFLLLCLSLPATVLTIGIFYTVACCGMYVLPLGAAICFLMLSLWQGFLACMTPKKKWKMYAHFACSGLALGLCAGARPSVAISAAIMIPLFLGILFRRDEKWMQKLLKAGAFALPLVAVVAGILVYNHARFGSYTDFGAEYQLTVSNIHANSLRLYAIPDGIYHYLLQPPELKGTFPFVAFSWIGLPNYERYRFTYSNMGILWVPMLALALVLLRTSCKGSYAETPQKGVTVLQKKALLLTGFAVAAVVAWMDFCLAGNGAQYIFDVAPVLGICAALVLLTTVKPETELRYRVTWLALVGSALMVILMMTAQRDGPVHENFPLLYQKTESLLAFWH